MTQEIDKDTAGCPDDMDLVRYFFGSEVMPLSEEEQGRLDEHVSSCEMCQGKRAGLEADVKFGESIVRLLSIKTGSRVKIHMPSDPKDFTATVLCKESVPLRDMIKDIDELQPELANRHATLITYRREDNGETGKCDSLWVLEVLAPAPA